MTNGEFESASCRFADGFELAQRLSRASGGGGAAVDQQSLALAFEYFCRLQLRLRMVAEARESFAEFVKLREELVKVATANAKMKRDLAIAYDNLGLTHVSEDYPLALELHKKSLAIRVAQLQANPRDDAAKLLVVKSHQQIGKDQLSVFNYRDAIAEFQIGLKRLDQIRESSGNS